MHNVVNHHHSAMRMWDYLNQQTRRQRDLDQHFASSHVCRNSRKWNSVRWCLVLDFFTSTMSRTKSSKSARSGLASVKRDWADSSKSSQEVLIPWEPTQRPAHALTGSEARLRAIQEALAGCRKSPSPPLVSSSTPSKR